MNTNMAPRRLEEPQSRHLGYQRNTNSKYRYPGEWKKNNRRYSGDHRNPNSRYSGN
jgi:hypothetical protein